MGARSIRGVKDTRALGVMARRIEKRRLDPLGVKARGEIERERHAENPTLVNYIR